MQNFENYLTNNSKLNAKGLEMFWDDNSILKPHFIKIKLRFLSLGMPVFTKKKKNNNNNTHLHLKKISIILKVLIP